MTEIVSHKGALALGLKRYFTGKPCKHGHVAERFIGGACVECTRQRSKAPEVRETRRQRDKKPEVRKVRREYEAKAREVKRAERLKRELNQSSELWQAILDRQGGNCALHGHGACSGKFRTDHDHDTGHLRGILCVKHDRGIGQLGDTVEGLRAALDYLERARVTS